MTDQASVRLHRKARDCSEMCNLVEESCAELEWVQEMMSCWPLRAVGCDSKGFLQGRGTLSGRKGGFQIMMTRRSLRSAQKETAALGFPRGPPPQY